MNSSLPRKSSSQLGLDLLHDAGKSRLVMHSDIGQHFAVDLDGSLLQAIGELAVRQAASACTGVDTRDPQLTELTLLLATVTVSILTSLGYCLDRYAIDA